MATPDISRFGTRVPDRDYIDRPSAYAIVRDHEGQVAVLRTPQGVFLPGGGLDADESPEQAVVRELKEECGFVARVRRCLGVADQYLYSDTEHTYYLIRSTFFEVDVVGSVPATETDHELCWLPEEVACEQLSRESQSWAIQECAARRT